MKAYTFSFLTAKCILLIGAICLIILASNSLQAQVSINTSGIDPDASAMLDISSYEKGILIPRMSVVGRDSISNPANGLLTYNVTDDAFNYYDNNQWNTLISELPTDADQQELSISNDSLIISGGNSIGIQEIETGLYKATSCNNINLINQASWTSTYALGNSQW